MHSKRTINRIVAFVSIIALILFILLAVGIWADVDLFGMDGVQAVSIAPQPGLGGDSAGASRSASDAVDVVATPSAQDRDGDGLPDSWEREVGLDFQDAAGDQGAFGDPDGDGLINIDEYYNNADPQKADTDDDGLPDLWEVENSLDPADPTGENGNSGDLDGDGVRNGDELATGTDPTSSDTDQDGVSDGIRFYAAHARMAGDDDAFEAPDGEIFRVGAPR